MTRRLMVSDHMLLVDPTPADVAAWLAEQKIDDIDTLLVDLAKHQEFWARTMGKQSVTRWLHKHPAEAVEIVRGLKVAGPWEESGEMDGSLYARRHDARDPGGKSVAWVSGGLHEGSLETEKAAADAALIADGWRLA